MAETTSRTVTISKRSFQLDRRLVEKTMLGVLGEPISSHYVVVGSRRYPPKQVIARITGLDRADFTSHQARRILMGLGFAVGRRPGSVPGTTVAEASHDIACKPHVDTPLPERGSEDELIDTLRSLRGEWVAIKDDELLVAASTPQDLLGWLARHRQKADSMFRVPEDELAMGGLAPL